MFQGKPHGKSQICFFRSKHEVCSTPIFFEIRLNGAKSGISMTSADLRPFAANKKKREALSFYNSDPDIGKLSLGCTFLNLQWQLASKKWMPGCVSIGHPSFSEISMLHFPKHSETKGPWVWKYTQMSFFEFLINEWEVGAIAGAVGAATLRTGPKTMAGSAFVLFMLAQLPGLLPSSSQQFPRV